MSARYESGEKFVRVMQLLTRLSDTATGVSTKQLAEELEVSMRTVQRYVAVLRDQLGMDIDESGDRLRIGEGSKLPPLQLDRYSATMLLVALRLLHQLRTEHDPALVAALAQLSRALRVPLVSRYLQRTLANAEARPENSERRRVERAVIDGFVDSRAVEVRYVDGTGNESKRVLHPYFVEPAPEGRNLYVFAHDELSRSVRAFRMDRIRDARALTQTFTVPEDFDVDEVVRGSWGIWLGGGQDQVVLRFAPEARRLVAETRWHESAVLTELPGGSTEVRLTVASEMEMRPWVLRWGALVEVLAPASLRSFVAGSMQRAAALYDAAPAPRVKPPRTGNR